MSLNALYVDFNSYFASVEQQLRPDLRGKPVGVLPVVAETTCCIAASYEAKAFGVKTGTKVSDARKLCPEMIFVEARPSLYVQFHHRLIEVVESCTHVEKTLSIDEMVCRLTGTQQQRDNAVALAQRIKIAITKKIGSEIRCSIGIAPNTFLAKVASNMQKPDGCTVIESSELPQRLYPLKLRDLNGIGKRMEERLRHYKIHTVEALYKANRSQLKTVWGSIEGEHFYDKLRGLELTDSRHDRSSLGHSHVLPPELRTQSAALAVLHRLLQKACLRLRSYGLHTSAIQIRVGFLKDATWVAESRCSPTDNTLSLTHALEQLWQNYPAHKSQPYKIGVLLSGLAEPGKCSIDLFQSHHVKSHRLDNAIDTLNMRYGKNTVYFGGAHNAVGNAPMRIAFNHIPDLPVEDDHNESPR